MIHRKRRFSVGTVDTPEELAEKLEQTIWTRCTGFRLGSYLWLNDSTGPDGAQEYAVVREDSRLQLESITVSWCTPAELRSYIDACVRGLWEGYYWASNCFVSEPPITNLIETPEQHRATYCPACD